MPLLSPGTSPKNKLDNVLFHFYNFDSPQNGKRGSVGGTVIDVRHLAHRDPQRMGYENLQEMKYYFDQLIMMKLLRPMSNTAFNVQGPFQTSVDFYDEVQITLEGLQRCFELESGGSFSNKCFVAMVFDNNKDARLAAIKAACTAHGFDAFDVENYNLSGNHTIDAKIISAIKSSRFCIVDFTKENPGAYFEGGYAMGRNMKVIFVCDQADFDTNKKHFDVNHYPFIRYVGFDDLTTKLTDEIGAYINE